MSEFDDVLRDALQREANAVQVSRRHAERILDAAAQQPRVTSRRELAYSRYGRARTLAGAAISVVLLSAIVIPLTSHESGPSTRSALSNESAALKTAVLTPTLVDVGAYVQGAAVPYADQVRLTSTSAHGSFSTASPGSFLKIEQTGMVDLVVSGSTLPSVIDHLGAIAIGLGGVVSNSQTSISHRDHGADSSGYVVLEVPAARFSTLVAKVRAAGRATSVQTSATDLTSQYSDLSARIHANEVSRAQYLSIMAQAHTIGAILSVQSQINTIQTRIDQLQGQLNVLSHETTFSTLSVYVSTPTHHVVPVTTARTGFSKAWHDAISGFLSGFQWVLRVLGPLAFVAVVLAALGLVVRSVRKVRERRSNRVAS